MEKVFITRNRGSRLIIIFAGWGMDANPFLTLHKPGYDILLVFDYTSFSPARDCNSLAECAREYDEVVVIGWSFGVRIANDFLDMNGGEIQLTKAIAVNGTTTHIDDAAGIPQAIFRGTLQNLSDITLRKFRRRMFASADAFSQFMSHAPQRTLSSLTSELETFGNIAAAVPSPRWTCAVTGGADAIFPPAAQQTAWQGFPADVYADMPHFPDFQSLLDRYIIDKELVAERFSEARHTYRDNALIQHSVARRLWELSREHLRMPANGAEVLEIGVGQGVLTDLYHTSLPDATLTLWDIADIDTASLPRNARFERCDAETAISSAPTKYDLIISASTIQWFNSPGGFIEKAAQALAPGGVLAIALYGPETYRELTRVTGNSLNYPTLGTLLSAAEKASLQPVEAKEETVSATFDSLKSLLRHIKLTGVNALERKQAGATSGRGNTSKAVAILRHYPTAPDGSATLTYHPIYLILKKQN